MTAHRARHLLLQALRHCCQVAVLGVVVAIVYLSLYAHYRAARAMEDEQFLKGGRGAALKQIDKRVSRLDDPEAFLDGYKGTWWSARVAGLDIADPLAAAEMTATAKTIHWPLLLSIVIPVIITLLLGRVFCSWMCPAGLLFEVAQKLRGLLRLAEVKPADVQFSHRNKYVVLGVGLGVAAATSLPIFALLYPPAVVSRLVHAWVFGTAMTGMLVLLGVLVVIELFVSPRWWCRTMCPGGALYGLIAWRRLLRVKLHAKQCTGCRDCEPVCPMGIYPVLDSNTIECDNCGLCLGHCPTKALYFTVRVTGGKKRGGVRPITATRVTAMVMLGVLLMMTNRAAGHHILGLPHYSYKENYPQAPTLEYPATTGPYDVLMTSYPGQPEVGEPANITFYIKDRTTGLPYEQNITARVLQTFTFGRNRTVVGATSIQPFDALHKLSVTFPENGEYVVELSMQVEGQTEVIPFLMTADKQRATKSILAATGAGLVVFVLVVRAIKVKRRRRAGGAGSAAAASVTATSEHREEFA